LFWFSSLSCSWRASQLQLLYRFERIVKLGGRTRRFLCPWWAAALRQRSAGSQDCQSLSKFVGVIIAGSGPTDRNGNSAEGVNANSYQYLARDLAALGMTTIRYDKRGVAGSSRLITSETAPTLLFTNYTDDAAQVAKWVLDSQKAPCVWLIGHSEGSSSSGFLYDGLGVSTLIGARAGDGGRGSPATMHLQASAVMLLVQARG